MKTENCTEELIKSFVEIKLLNDNDFLLVKETLQRIGIAGKPPENSDPNIDKCLYQSAHILHKRGKYYLVHFKELFLLDGKESDFGEEDKARRNTIAHLLEQWELLEILNPEVTETPRASMANIRIISHKEKKNWLLCAKYNLGKKKKS